MTDFFRRLIKEKPLSIIAGVVILLLMLVAIFADVLAPFPHDEVNIVDRMQAPSGRYLLGTDQLGRDLLSRLIFGAQISLTVGLAATAVNVVVAVLIGGPSGFFGGRLDLAAQRFVDAWMAFPGLLLLLTIMSLVGRGVPQIIVVLGVTGGIGGSRVIRGAVIGIKENVYFQAAEAIGSTKWRILIRHVLPNIAAPVIIIFTINVGGVIISEAALSFLGFGLPISVPSWGGMLSREGREFMEVAPRLALYASGSGETWVPLDQLGIGDGQTPACEYHLAQFAGQGPYQRSLSHFHTIFRPAGLDKISLHKTECMVGRTW